MAEMVSCVSPSFVAKKHCMSCALIPISPFPPPAAMSGQSGCLSPNSTDVSAAGMHRLYSVEFLGAHPLYILAGVSSRAIPLLDAFTLQNQCHPQRILAGPRGAALQSGW